MIPTGRHLLDAEDLRDLADGADARSALQLLRAARLSRTRLLVEGARRRALGPVPSATGELLARVQERHPSAVDAVFLLPQTSAWAFDCLTTPDPDAGYLTALTIAAAVGAGEPFDLRVEVTAGALSFPGLGTLRLPAGSGPARLRSDGHGLSVEGGAWEETPRIRAESGDLTLDVALEAGDPHLAKFGVRPRWPDKDELAEWQAMLTQGWRVVVANDPALATDLAADLQVIVPLKAAPGQPSLSATSGWTPGAVALSLPPDPLSCAETLIHEHRHYVLGLVEDIVPPLVDPDSTVLCYAPWRDDPRPPSGLLHGCFAHVAVTRYWRRQREICAAEDIPRVEVEFARWREATTEAVYGLQRSGALTAQGEGVAAAMRQTLEGWRGDGVSAEALATATAMNAEHRLRWRQTHLGSGPSFKLVHGD